MSQLTIHTDANQQADADGRYRRQVVRGASLERCVLVTEFFVLYTLSLPSGTAFKGVASTRLRRTGTCSTSVRVLVVCHP
jgi:hypothetical protein